MYPPYLHKIIHGDSTAKYKDGGAIGYSEIKNVSEKLASGEMFSKYGLELAGRYPTHSQAHEHGVKLKGYAEVIILPDGDDFVVFTKAEKKELPEGFKKFSKGGEVLKFSVAVADGSVPLGSAKIVLHNVDKKEFDDYAELNHYKYKRKEGDNLVGYYYVNDDGDVLITFSGLRKVGEVVEYKSGGSIESQLEKFAKKDIAILEKDGAMAITDTKHGVIHGQFENGVFKFYNRLGEEVFSGGKQKAVEFVKNSYTVEQN